ncbi:uncharacterized protein LOC108047777 [Drosophila rhopaloa]|uniref:PPIase cyclophilin-type domain-containing protein n=1 Tax=Drosophila rhopaloa TaxID=1041015 RepID=A0ABM5HQ07_DRORH|nr:uncharacterized protein LOC108047777 [Drosophila rhopaloa]
MSQRGVAFSEFYINAPTSRSTQWRAQKVANELVVKNKEVRDKLMNNRVPTYSEFRRIMRSAGREADYNPITYKSMIEIRQAQIDRRRLKSIKSCADSLGFHPRILNRSQLVTEFNQKQDIFRKNLELLGRINRTNRLKGCVDSFNRNFPALQPNRTKIHALAQRLSQENRQFGCRLSAVKSKVDSHNPWVAPVKPLEQKASDQTVSAFLPYMPSPRLGKRSAHVLLRPIIYFDLAVRENFLGRLLLQLYTELSPEVVLEFVRMATHNDVRCHRFVRIFSNLWMEGELMPGSNDPLRNHHSVKYSFLDPSKLTGVISYPWDYRRHFPQGLLSYTISFKPSAVPWQRVIFGRVCGGLRVLQNCHEFGTKNGKTKKTVIVTRCGLL